MDYVLSAERQPKSVGFDSLRDEKGQSVRNIRRNMRQILQVKHYKMGEKINDDMNDLFELASRHTAISLMLATFTKNHEISIAHISKTCERIQMNS